MSPTDRAEGPRTLEVPLGTRVVVLGPLNLRWQETAVSAPICQEIAALLDNWDGPGLVVLAGGLASPSSSIQEMAKTLDCHPRLLLALRRFSRASGRTIVYLPDPGDQSSLDPDALKSLMADRAASIVLPMVDLRVETASGTKKVRVDPGEGYTGERPVTFGPHERLAAFGPQQEPGSQEETRALLARGLVAEVIPRLTGSNRDWLRGVDRLTDTSALPRFVASRLFYRRLARYGWWVAALLAATALTLKLPLLSAASLLGMRTGSLAWPARVGLVAASTVLDMIVLLGALALLSRRIWSVVAGPTPRAPTTSKPPGGNGQESGAPASNDVGRAAARALVTDGFAGLVGAHTLRAELSLLGPGFYANCGCGTALSAEIPARLALPSVFLPQRVLSWVELEGGADLHVRLLHSSTALSRGTLLERLATAGRLGRSDALTVVGSHPNGPAWPRGPEPSMRQRLERRVAAGSIAVAGILNLLSALSPRLRHPLGAVLDVVPLGVSQVAAALGALSGLGLLSLARGVRRGQRQAWAISVALLAGTSVLQLMKDGDVVTTCLALFALWYLVAHRWSFRAPVDRASLQRGLRAVLAGAIGVTLLATAAVELTQLERARHDLPSLPSVLEAVLGRLVGAQLVPLPHRIDEFLSPGLLAIGLALACYTLYVAFRPVVETRPARLDARARSIVERYGRGTLDYFALRDDKSFFFFGSSVIAYGNWGGLCLVSPDPIGPEAEREPAWSAFRHFVDRQGWALGVLGAGEEWLPIYRQAGMRDMYVGDEAVVDTGSFSLEGGRQKGLRQAVNRIARNGYTITFHDPSRLDRKLVEGLEEVMQKSRRGKVERGFSMTLGRAFDQSDRGLLLAVAHAPDGSPVAFCQYVPAPGIGGYSLDLMRRDDGRHPNGLLDFVVVGTIMHMKAAGGGGLGLNFATMRAVLAGEGKDAIPQRAERWVLKRMSDSMQIESLWRFNAKYDPRWLPRFVVYDSPENVVALAMAIARAESFWELPVIGRFLTPPLSRQAKQEETTEERPSRLGV